MIFKRAFIRTCLGVLLLIASDPVVVCGDEPVSNLQLRFRRVYAPADRLADWPKGNALYKPINASDFERLVTRLGGPPTDVAEAQIVSSEYTAQLQGDDVLAGKVTMEVRSLSDRPVMMPLTPCEIALSDPEWEDDHGRRLARMGLDSDNRMVLLIDGPGKLHCNWSLRGRRDSGGQLKFQFQLPPSLARKLVLTLPETLQPDFKDGLVTLQEDSESDQKVWKIDLPARNRLQMRIARRSADGAEGRFNLVKQALTYDLSMRGLQLDAEWTLGVYREPLKQLVVRIDSELQLVDAQLGEQHIAWATKGRVEDGTLRTVLSFPQPIVGADRVLRLLAVAPLVTQGAWKLPGIKPDGLFWQEGAATLLVAEPLSVARMNLEGCRQLRTSVLPGPASGEAIELQYHGSEAKVEVLLSTVPPEMTIDALTTYELDDHAISSRMVCDCTVKKAEKFKLQAVILGNWQIESVVSRPPGMIESWETQETDSRQILKIDLKRGISPEAPLRLGIVGRSRQGVPGESIDSSQLEMLQFDGIRRQLVHVVARDPFRLRVTGPDALRQVAPSALLTEDRSRLAESFSEDRVVFQDRPLVHDMPGDAEDENQEVDKLEGMFWLNDPGPARFRLTLEKPSPQFTAITEITARIEENNLQENIHVECTPQKSSVDWVVVAFAEKRDESPRWSVIDVDGVVLDSVRAVRLPPGPQDDPLMREKWKVSWTRPLSENFQLVAERNTEFADLVPVNLVSLPQAIEQLGTVTIFSEESAKTVVENRILKPLPAEQVPSRRQNQVVARYRYDPERHLGTGGHAALLVGTNKEFAQMAVVWQAVAESRFAPDGSGRHRITYYLENDGSRDFKVALDSKMRIGGAKIDGVAVRMPPSESTNSISLALPEDQRFTVVELQLVTGAPSTWLDMIRKIQLPVLQLEVPILHWQRILHAPAGFAITDGIDRGDNGRDALAWRERLFGPLARDEHLEVFDPFDRKQWSAAAMVPVAESQHDRQLATDFLDAFGKTLEQNWQFASWEQLANIDLRGAVSRSGTPSDDLEVWIDSQALGEAGIGPNSPIVVAANRTSQQLATDALMAANLVVAVVENRLLVSSVDRIEPTATNWLVEGVLCGNFYADQAHRAQLISRQAGEPATDWVANGDLVKSPWKIIWREGYATTENRGTTTCYLEGKRARDSEVYLIHTSSIHALQWTLFFVVSVGGCAWPLSKLRTGVLLILALAVLALVMPAVIAPLVNAVLLGVVVAILWQVRTIVWRPARQKITLPQKMGNSLSTTQTLRFFGPEILLLLFAASVFFAVPRGLIAQSLLEAIPKDKSLSVVFIPVDSDNHPVGKTYYVEEALFKALHQRAKSESEGPTDWLLASATYRGQMEWDSDRRRLALTTLTGSFVVEVFGHQAEVRIPVGGLADDATSWKMSVDGKATRQVRSASDGTPILEIDAPGIYQIEIQLAAEAEIHAGLQRFDISIPPLATSRLELEVPVDAPPIEISSAIGGTVRQDNRGRVTAQLGAASRLAVSWRESRGADAGAVADVDRLLWLKIQPGAVVIDARIHLNVQDHRVRRLQLAADPQLRLLSPILARPDGKPVELSHVRTIPGDPQIIELEFARSVTGIQEIRLPFLLTGITGVGNVRLPYLDLIGARTSRHSVAVSVDAALQIDRNNIPQNEGLIAVSAAMMPDFWDIAEQKPALFYRQTQLEIDWSFPTRPQEPDTVALQRLSFGFSDTHVDAIAEFDLETTAGHRFDYHIYVPKGFVAQKVELISKGINRVARWTVSPDGKMDNRLAIFLTGPVTGKQQLVIRGQFPGSIGERELPDFLLDGIRSRGRQVAIYRQPSVEVELKSAENVQSATDGDIVPTVVPSNFGQLVDVFLLDRNAKKSRVEVRRNPLEVTSQQIVSINRVSGQWVGEIDLKMGFKKGALDNLRLQIPPEFPGPFTLDPEIPYRVENLASSESRVLLVRLPEGISGDYRLMIRGPLNIAAGDLVSCPVVSTDEIDKSTRYVVLPKQVDLQDVQWKTAGLVKRSIPQDPQEASWSDKSFESFLVTGETYRAVLKSLNTPRQSPSVRLADIKIKGLALDRYLGRAMFDLEPAGLSRVRVQLPEDAQLLRACVEGLAATPQRRGKDWELELGSENLSQAIEVVYEAPLSTDSEGVFAADAPQLYADAEKIEINNTLWSMTGSESFWKVFPNPEIELNALVLQQHHKRIGCLLDLLSDVTSAEPVKILSPWYRRQIARLNAARRELTQYYNSESLQQSSVQSARQLAFEQRVKELSDQMVSLGVFASAEQFQAAGMHTADAWNWSFANEGRYRFGLFAGEKEKFPVGQQSGGDSNLLARIFLALALGGIGLMVGFARWQPVGMLSRESSVLLGAFIVSLFYWLFLTPSILGFIALVATVVLALSFRWDRMIRSPAPE